jgi:hypothetical protein
MYVCMYQTFFYILKDTLIIHLETWEITIFGIAHKISQILDIFQRSIQEIAYSTSRMFPYS